MSKHRIQLPDLTDFCRRWRIQRLELFGSALRDDFAPESDLDFLYTFEPGSRWSLFDLGDMEDELRLALGRNVDFVARSAIERSRNEIRRSQILSNTRVLYAA